MSTLIATNPATSYVPQIINLPITPYSDDVATYVNNLEPEEIYRMFNERNTADVLTAALYAIYQLESNAHNTLIKGEKISESWILDEAQRQCPNNNVATDFKILMSLSDVYFRDNLLFKANLNDLGQYPNVFIVTVDGMYAGHTYAWTVDMEVARVTNVIGIRSAIIQIMADRCGLKQQAIAPMFLKAIQQWSEARNSDNDNQSNDHYIRILQPIGPMPRILTKCGFSPTKRLRNVSEMKWLFDNLSLGNTPLTSGLIFREYDYIVKVSDSLKCVSPAYLYKTI